MASWGALVQGGARSYTPMPGREAGYSREPRLPHLRTRSAIPWRIRLALTAFLVAAVVVLLRGGSGALREAPGRGREMIRAVSISMEEELGLAVCRGRGFASIESREECGAAGASMGVPFDLPLEVVVDGDSPALSLERCFFFNSSRPNVMLWSLDSPSERSSEKVVHLNSRAALRQAVCDASPKRENRGCAALGCNAAFETHSGCQCNPACTRYSDCCPDYREVCLPPRQPKSTTEDPTTTAAEVAATSSASPTTSAPGVFFDVHAPGAAEGLRQRRGQLPASVVPLEGTLATKTSSSAPPPSILATVAASTAPPILATAPPAVSSMAPLATSAPLAAAPLATTPPLAAAATPPLVAAPLATTPPLAAAASTAPLATTPPLVAAPLATTPPPAAAASTAPPATTSPPATATTTPTTTTTATTTATTATATTTATTTTVATVAPSTPPPPTLPRTLPAPPTLPPPPALPPPATLAPQAAAPPAVDGGNTSGAATTTHRTQQTTTPAAAAPELWPMGRRVLKGVSYAPVPLRSTRRPQSGHPLPDDDFMSNAASALWSADGRADLAVIESLGANAVRLYGNDAALDKRGFLDEAHRRGLEVLVGISDYPYLQMPGNCLTTERNCYMQVRDSYRKNLERGFLVKDPSSGLRTYHPALQTISLMNEPDLKFLPSERPGSFLKPILSAFDAVLHLEEELQVAGPMPNLTVTFSFAVCPACPDHGASPAVGQMSVLRDAMRDPAAFGYNTTRDLWGAYVRRFENSVNTANPAGSFNSLFLHLYDRVFPGVPVFVGEYHAPQVRNQVADLKEVIALAGNESNNLKGISFFEFQARYDKGGSELAFGLFGLGNRSLGRFALGPKDKSETYHAWCLAPLAAPAYVVSCPRVATGVEYVPEAPASDAVWGYDAVPLVHDADGCCAKCMEFPPCRAWTWSGGRCRLSGRPATPAAARHVRGAVSGALGDRLLPDTAPSVADDVARAFGGPGVDRSRMCAPTAVGLLVGQRLA